MSVLNSYAPVGFFRLLPFYFSPDLSISFHSSYKSEVNSKYLPVQSQQKSTTKGVKYLQMSLTSFLLLPLNRFRTFFWCFGSWLWRCKYRLESVKVFRSLLKSFRYWKCDRYYKVRQKFIIKCIRYYWVWLDLIDGK